jgi:hypothetical protein
VQVVGEHNRAVAAQVWTIERRALVDMMSLATARTEAPVGMAELVRSAAENWDSSDPVRVLMG